MVDQHHLRRPSCTGNIPIINNRIFRTNMENKTKRLQETVLIVDLKVNTQKTKIKSRNYKIRQTSNNTARRLHVHSRIEHFTSLGTINNLDELIKM